MEKNVNKMFFQKKVEKKERDMCFDCAPCVQVPISRKKEGAVMNTGGNARGPGAKKP